MIQNDLDKKIALKFLNRLKEKELSIDDNPESHFCVYFAPYNTSSKQVFIGHHKKSGLWLFNGGHVDKDEDLEQTLEREIYEEWGLDANNFNIKKLGMLTITDINNLKKQPCRTHYDLWNFIEIKKREFHPSKEKLGEEFFEAGWKNLNEAKKLIGNNNNQTLEAINFIKKKYF